MDFSKTKQQRTVLSQINVTPFVDVMLVLLIIFMVTAPMLEEGLDVNLPKVKAAGLPASGEEPLVITINKEGAIFINKNRILFSDLKGKLEKIYQGGRRKQDMVLLKADKDAFYGHVVKVMAEIRKAGIERVGMMTESVEEG